MTLNRRKRMKATFLGKISKSTSDHNKISVPKQSA